MTARALLLVAPLFVAASSCQRDSLVAHLPESPSSKPKLTKPHPNPPTPAAAAAPAPVAAAPAPAAAAADPAAPATTSSPFLSGTTEAHRKSTLTPKVSSAVTRVHVREGDTVKVNQPLVTLDTRDFQLRTQQAEAARDGAKVQLDAAKLDWTRIKSLLAEKAVPQAQFDAIDARYKGAVAGLAAAETAVAMGRKALHDSVVRAPFDGLIIKRMVNEGEYASVMPATPLVIVEEVDPLDLRIQIPSTDLNKAKAGDTMKVRFPAIGQTLEARLTRVVAAMDPRTRTFSAIAELPNKDHSLRSGLYAEVSFAASKPAGVEAPAAKAKAAAAKAGAAKKPAPVARKD